MSTIEHIPIIGKFFSIKNNSSLVIDETVKSLNSDEMKFIFNFKNNFYEFNTFCPGNPNFIHAGDENHMDQIVKLISIVSSLKQDLENYYKILIKLELCSEKHYDQITGCNFILLILNDWHNNDIIASNKFKNLANALRLISKENLKYFDKLNKYLN